MSKIPQSEADLQKHMEEQLDLIAALADLYDKGSEVAAKPIATAVRVILHDTSSSHSLLEQLDLTGGTKFFDVVPSQDVFANPNIKRLGSFSGLTALPVGGGKHTPYLDEPVGATTNTNFDVYWNKIVFIDNKERTFTRRELILAVANQDGGAHVDPKLDEKYVQLSRKNSLGYTGTLNISEPTDIEGAALAGVRQIGHEILRTFRRGYPHKKMVHNGAIALLSGAGLVLSKDGSIPEIFKHYIKNRTERYPGTPRKFPCPCGSGKKYKRCCTD